jgi:Xaa-Pro aminopeptidase
VHKPRVHFAYRPDLCTFCTCPCAGIRTEEGIKRWAEEVKVRLGKLAEGKIGVDLWTPDIAQWVQKYFPKAQFVDGKRVLTRAQMIKTRDEMECQKIANMITEAGFQALLENLKAGVKECELLAIAGQKFTELGSEWSQCANIVCSGPYTAPYRRFASDRVIREGDLVIVDIGAGFNGYWGDFTRTYVCGKIKPTKEQIELCQESYNTLFNACGDARVGKTNQEMGKHLNDPVENPHSGGLSGGHGAGVGPWEPPLLHGMSPDMVIPLEPGMLFSVEPDIFTTLPFDERLLKDIHPLDKTTARTRIYPQQEDGGMRKVI